MSESLIEPELRVPKAPAASASPADSPLDTILMVTGGYCVAKALQAVADCGIADAIGDREVSIGAVAKATGTDPDVLGRLLRLLNSHGLFEAHGDSVAHNDASRLLRTDHPQSARSLARMFGLPFFWRTFEDFTETLHSGEPAAKRVFPEGLWAWFAENPEASSVFDEAMRGKSFAQVAGVVQAYDFSPFSRVADIGGGRGHLLQAILQRWDQVKGTLFEQPHVIEQAQSIGTDRLALLSGDFFRDRLPESDCYVLMEVIHDWDDDAALKILGAVRDAAPVGATLLLVEQLIPETERPNWVQMLDIHMLALFGARQRTRQEYERLLRKSGFLPTNLVDTFSGAAIIEARAS
jgi:hypothetical protein